MQSSASDAASARRLAASTPPASRITRATRSRSSAASKGWNPPPRYSWPHNSANNRGCSVVLLAWCRVAPLEPSTPQSAPVNLARPQNHIQSHGCSSEGRGIFFTWGTIIRGRLERGTIVQMAKCPGNELLAREAFARVASPAPAQKWPVPRYMHTPTIYSSTV